MHCTGAGGAIQFTCQERLPLVLMHGVNQHHERLREAGADHASACVWVCLEMARLYMTVSPSGVAESCQRWL